jgi:hypothetical protein
LLIMVSVGVDAGIPLMISVWICSTKNYLYLCWNHYTITFFKSLSNLNLQPFRSSLRGQEVTQWQVWAVMWDGPTPLGTWSKAYPGQWWSHGMGTLQHDYILRKYVGHFVLLVVQMMQSPLNFDWLTISSTKELKYLLGYNTT